MRPGKPVHILVADDVLQWRVQIRSIVHRRPEWQVIGEACDGVQAAEKAAKLHPDVVLLDIGMPGLNGIEAAKRISRDCPHSRIIFVTQEDDADIRAAALATGAENYLLKSDALHELLPAVEAAMRDVHDTRAPLCDCSTLEQSNYT